MPPAQQDSEQTAERWVVLLRHETAEDRAPEGRDEDRHLSAEGHARVKKLGQGLAKIFPRVQAIYSSPLVRATQTALWVAKAYRSRVAPETTELLTPGAPTDELLRFVRSTSAKRIILVGHKPELSSAFRAMTGIHSSVELKTGGAFGIRLMPDGSSVVEWILPPAMLSKIAS